MAHIPYGYKIVDVQAVIDENQSAIVRTLFKGYISGLSLKVAAEKAGLHICHGSAGRMLRNTHYLGDEYYPAIIEKELFDQAEEICISRAESLGRIRELEKTSFVVADTQFSLNAVPIKFPDPFEQAEYAYSLIESEVKKFE